MKTTGRDNGSFDDAQRNVSDADSRYSASGDAKPDLVQVSRLAITACVLAVTALLLLLGMIPVSHRGTPSHVRDVYQSVAWAVALCAVALSLASLVRIGLSKGRLTGGGYAWTGVSLMVLHTLLLLTFQLLARTRCVALTNTCGANLSGIGKAMLIYANDYEDELPRAGGRSSVWTGSIPDWTAPDRYTAYGVNRTNGDGGSASISSCFYLLVKYSEVKPESFICKGDVGATPFRLADLPGRTVPRHFELIDAWDFGPTPWLHCSYSYHMPYGIYALNTSYLPGFAVAADRNPWMASPSAKAGDFTEFQPDLAPFGGTREQARKGNTPPHGGDGQNVLFLDSHVEFAKLPYCAIEDDNIYTISGNPTGGDPLGTPPKLGSQPTNRKDSLLVNDPPAP